MSKKKSTDPILDELVTIKKLLILALYGTGFASEEIHKATGMGATNIRGMFSKKKLNKIGRGLNEE